MALVGSCHLIHQMAAPSSEAR